MEYIYIWASLSLAYTIYNFIKRRLLLNKLDLFENRLRMESTGLIENDECIFFENKYDDWVRSANKIEFAKRLLKIKKELGFTKGKKNYMEEHYRIASMLDWIKPFEDFSFLEKPSLAAWVIYTNEYLSIKVGFGLISFITSIACLLIIG